MKGFRVLYIEFDDVVKNDSELLEKYETRVKNHNNMVKNNLFPDSGFDLLTPNLENISFDANETKLIPFGVKCSAFHFVSNIYKNLPVYEYISQYYKKGIQSNIHAQPFCVYPRSSIWKSHFRLANNVGIIDSGYRGTLYGPMYNVKNTTNELVYGNRYLQITMPDLQPFYVKIVDSVNVDSKRGSGGIGSTGN
jgi:dUTPase